MATNTATSAGGRLRHELSYLDLTMASLGGIIGSGWLYGAWKGGFLAGPASTLSWVIGGIAVLLIGLVYAELGGALPEAGGIVRYPQYSHGTFVSYMMGWGALIAYASVPPIEAEAAVQFMSHYIPALYSASSLTALGIWVSVLFMILFFLINYFGVGIFGKTNTVWTLIKLGVPLLAIVVLFFSGHFNSANFSSYGGFTPSGSSAVLAAVPLGGIIFAYLGFRQALDLAGEAKNPQRDVPRAVLTAIIIGVVLYVLLQTVWVGTMPASKLVHGWAGTQALFTAPFTDLAAVLGFGWLAALLLADAVWSPSGTGNVYLASTSRVMYAMSKNRYFPRIFLWVHPKSGVPVWALFGTFVIGLVFLLPFPSWSALVGIVSSATVFTYIIGPVSIAVLRRTMPDMKRPFYLKGMSVIGPAAFVIASLIIYWSGWATDSLVLLVILFGVVLYAYGTSTFADDTTIYAGRYLKAGVWLVVYLVVMLALTYIGSSNFGAPHQLIPYPLDLVVVVIISLIFYYWAVASGIPTYETEAKNKEIASGQQASAD
ncbi:MAG: APC family permease [Thermaerobacter sp.]|nr:APC family permease [Thermaerobacter sp.]